MTRIAKTKVTCPDCKREVDWPLYESVNVTLDPPLREKVISQALFRFSCPGCGLRATIVDPLLYHDMDRRLMVQLIGPGESFDAAQTDEPLRRLGGVAWEVARGFTTRVVLSPNELVEKILADAAGLDDRHLECLKARLKFEQSDVLVGDVYFARREQSGALSFVHLVDGELDEFEVPAADWEAHVALLGDLGPPNADRWARIDLAWANALYAERGGMPL